MSTAENENNLLVVKSFWDSHSLPAMKLFVILIHFITKRRG
jgi:hypothetical protein